MIPMVRVRPVQPDEYEEAGAVTALAYREFMPPDGEWGGYEKRLADVAARATRALVLVADLDGTIAATATLELDQRINPDTQPPPLAADEAQLRMLGVHPEHRRNGIGRLLVHACYRAGASARKAPAHARYDRADGPGPRAVRGDGIQLSRQLGSHP